MIAPVRVSGAESLKGPPFLKTCLPLETLLFVSCETCRAVRGLPACSQLVVRAREHWANADTLILHWRILSSAPFPPNPRGVNLEIWKLDSSRSLCWRGIYMYIYVYIHTHIYVAIMCVYIYIYIYEHTVYIIVSNVMKLFPWQRGAAELEDLGTLTARVLATSVLLKSWQRSSVKLLWRSHTCST